MLRRIEIGDVVTDGAETGRVVDRRRAGYPAAMVQVEIRTPRTAMIRRTWKPEHECLVFYRFGFVRRLIYGPCDEGCI
jgi:hypothetical protein